MSVKNILNNSYLLKKSESKAEQNHSVINSFRSERNCMKYNKIQRKVRLQSD